MNWVDLLKSIISFFIKRENTSPVTSIADVPVVRQNIKLSEHFDLYELTVTSNTSLQLTNRTLTSAQVEKLRELAGFLEYVRSILKTSVTVNSAYRCAELNGATSGSSSTSQHPRCEAADIHLKGMTLEAAFVKLRTALKNNGPKFGQLILETAQRSYGVSQWIHISVVGTLSPEKVGQVLKMRLDSVGKPRYTLLETIK